MPRFFHTFFINFPCLCRRFNWEEALLSVYKGTLQYISHASRLIIQRSCCSMASARPSRCFVGFSDKSWNLIGILEKGHCHEHEGNGGQTTTPAITCLLDLRIGSQHYQKWIASWSWIRDSVQKFPLESSESESCSASWCSPRQATRSVWCFSWPKKMRDESDIRGKGSYSWSYMAIKKNRRNSGKPISPGNLWLGSVHGYCWWKTSCIKIASNEYLC